MKKALLLLHKMRGSLCLTLVIAFGLFTSQRALAQPANDLCANATPIACGGTASGSTAMANNDGPAADCGGGSTAPDVWYTITGTGGAITASLCGGTDYDSQLDVYTGTCGALVNIGGCSDDFCGLQSQMTWTSTLGTLYRIRVHGFGGSTGNYSLAVTCAPTGPANDLCANATPIACGGSASGSTLMATNDGPATDCNGGSTAPDVWYTITGTGAAITASLCVGGTDYDSQLDVYTGACGALTNIGGCSDDFCGVASQMTWTSTFGVTYRIRVHGFAGATGNFTLTMTCVSTFPPNQSATVACPALAVAPTPPVVLDPECGGPITPALVISNVPNPIACEGTRAYVYTYLGCAGLEGIWTFTYTIERLPFTLPPDGAATVACPNLLPMLPPLPVVFSNCGEGLPPTSFSIVNNPNPLTCEGTRTFMVTYQDCEGNTATWNFVYTVERLPFTVPANGAATVACPALATQPAPPVVLSNCGETLTPTGPVVTNNPNPLTCEGTRTYTWTYTDCEGNSLPWSHVVTVERLPFSVPANGGATVACPDQTDTQPTAPVVLSNCGEVLVPVITSTAKPGCEGNRNWNFTYTDCEGNTVTWTFIYTVEYLDFIVPISVVGAVECPLSAFEPDPPTIYDNCNKLLTPTGPVITSTTNAYGCEGSRKYEWTYKDCEGNTHTWSQTFLFQYSADFFAPADEVFPVNCVLYAVPPFPPAIYDNCGNLIKTTGPVMTQSLSAGGCSGWRTYSFVYTDCGGHSHPWVYTYLINDDVAPLGTCPSGGGGVSVSVANLTCIEEVPCPASYDFLPKVEELLEAGDFFDYCSDLTVTLESWTDLWQCSDPDGDGVYTYGRTFYFHIVDQCGNEFPDVCAVTYSGECEPITTFSEAAWGNAGGAPGTSVSAATTDLQVIQTLLGSGPVVVGGGNRSLTVNDAQCVVDLLPGFGGPDVLKNCHQTNCTGCNPMGIGGMKNALAANAIALTLNMRFSVQYNGMTMADVRNEGLECIGGLHPCIYFCNENGCQLYIFDEAGNQYLYPYTIGGLLDLANFYLGGNLTLSPGQEVLYATALNKSLDMVNAYWNEGVVATSCDPGADAAPVGGGDKVLPVGKTDMAEPLDFSLAPNPAGSEVAFTLAPLDEAQEVVLTIHNYLGQQLLRKEFGKVTYVNERVDLSGLGNGLYLVGVKAGQQRFEKKLVIGKE
ncbi:MAG: T9SS type A sorting domain-containing protein [Bacteroidetes bacterium]|nr:T9SS type A sorting domain-containing protein [Bacteroidota bacterium]